jgi:hypothetical protein
MKCGEWGWLPCPTVLPFPCPPNVLTPFTRLLEMGGGEEKKSAKTAYTRYYYCIFSQGQEQMPTAYKGLHTP